MLKNKKKKYEKPEQLWHYTVGTKIKSIMESGVIRPATEGIDADERPAVWLSCHPVWEETANKALLDKSGNRIPCSKEGTAQHGDGLFRISVNPTNAIPWTEYKTLSGISRRTADGLERAGLAAGGIPMNWYAIFGEVERQDWLSVEKWIDGRWVEFDWPKT